MNTNTKIVGNRFGSGPDDLVLYPHYAPGTGGGSDGNVPENRKVSDFLDEVRHAVFQKSNMTVAERSKQARRILGLQKEQLEFGGSEYGYRMERRSRSHFDHIFKTSSPSVSVSPQAIELNFNDLTWDERSALTHETYYDPNRHAIFKFVVTISNVVANAMLSRKQKRQSYESADRVLVSTRRGSDQIEILGITPRTITTAGQHVFDFIGVPILEISDANPEKLMVVGPVKNQINSKNYSVYASRTVEAAQWVFTKPYISTTTDFDLQLLCSIPKSMPPQDRIVLCDVTIAEQGRKLSSIINQPIQLIA